MNMRTLFSKAYFKKTLIKTSKLYLTKVKLFITALSFLIYISRKKCCYYKNRLVITERCELQSG